jgi:hypothetical protein
MERPKKGLVIGIGMVGHYSRHWFIETPFWRLAKVCQKVCTNHNARNKAGLNAPFGFHSVKGDLLPTECLSGSQALLFPLFGSFPGWM